MDVCEFRPVTDTVSETEAKAEVRSNLYHKRLNKEQGNVELWLRFVAVQVCF